MSRFNKAKIAFFWGGGDFRFVQIRRRLFACCLGISIVTLCKSINSTARNKKSIRHTSRDHGYFPGNECSSMG